MGTGQMLLTVGAIMLLGTIILTTNRSLYSSKIILLKTNFGLDAVSLATSVIEEAQGKAFDEATDTASVATTSQLTPPGSLGQENGNPNDLNDFDDYNGLNNAGRMDTFKLSTGVYYVKTRVCYVDGTSLDGTSAQATFSKRLDVMVWNKEDSADVVRMSVIFSYWYF
ncbi:MAG: hypothetical protein M1469_09165 [Bacteroidetes bacterium]|nr:hypothetical protein [Bacteroidota bacterium]